MLARELTTTGLRVVDAAGHVCEVTTTDWTSETPAHEFSVPPDETAAGTTTEFRIPATLTVVRSDAGTRRLAAGDAVTLDAREHVLDATGPVGTLARFDGPARVSAAEDGVTVCFDRPTRVEFGFLSRVTAHETTIQVPETAHGLATALGAMTAAHRTTAPERARPVMRRHPPRLSYGDTVSIPDEVADGVPETEISILVPDDLAAVLDVAPLAFYLGASTELGDSARVRAPGVDVPLDSEESAARLLERAFWLDALAWDGSTDPRLRDLGLSAERVAAAAPAERLRLALDAPFERVEDRLPEWPLAMYVEPTPEYARALPAILDRLAHVNPAETVPLESRELVERTLDDFYRRPPGPIATVEMENPRLRRGRTHGWLADGTPIDVFKSLPEAYDHGLEQTEQGGTLTVSVVLNDPEMTRERDRVADIYREHARDGPLDVTLHADLSRAELASVLEAETDFVHYIGHCEEDGLRCTDGTLAADSLATSNVRTFFLNACGSYFEGLDLVRAGSVAGAVTFRKVLDEHAARVGTAFARLLVNGFTVERALGLARRRIVMGKDYAVVGDGTWTLTRSDAAAPGVFTVDTTPEGYDVEYDAGSVWAHGDRYRSPLPGRDVRFSGDTATATLDAGRLAAVLDDADDPVVFDGKFCWSDAAAERVRNGQEF